jgi:hypothetical protein
LAALAALGLAASRADRQQPSVAICVAIKDQAVDVREWVYYHRAIGVDKFYIWDTGSKPPLLNAVKDFVHEGLVHYEYDDKVPPKPGTHGPQVALYDRCLERWGSSHDFMAFIDTDEFLVLRDGTPDLPTLLNDYMGHGGLVVNWQVFGSGGLKVRPKRGACWHQLSATWAAVQQGNGAVHCNLPSSWQLYYCPALSLRPAAAAQGQLNDVLLAVQCTRPCRESPREVHCAERMRRGVVHRPAPLLLQGNAQMHSGCVLRQAAVQCAFTCRGSWTTLSK